MSDFCSSDFCQIHPSSLSHFSTSLSSLKSSQTNHTQTLLNLHIEVFPDRLLFWLSLFSVMTHLSCFLSVSSSISQSLIFNATLLYNVEFLQNHPCRLNVSSGFPCRNYNRMKLSFFALCKFVGPQVSVLV